MSKTVIFILFLLHTWQEPRKTAWFFFCVDWEQRKLDDLVERVVRKNTNNESTLPLTISAQYGLVDQFTYFNNRVASRDVSNYYLLYNGEFAYNKSTSDGFPFGTVKRLDFYEKGVLSTLYIVFSIKKENLTDSNFLTVFFDTDRWHKGISERAAEGARNHGLLNISADDFFDIDLTIPRNKNEQIAIGKFIRCLDNLITLHQRKQKSVFSLGSKQKRVQKMTNDWEQRKLGEMGRTFTGLSGKTRDDFGHGEARFVTYMNVYLNPIADPKMTEAIEIDAKQTTVQYGDVFFTTSSETPDEVGMSCIWLENQPNTYLNSFCFGYRPTKPFDAYFIAYSLRSTVFREKMILLAQGISRYNISKNKVMDLPFSEAGRAEQSKVGCFLKTLDNLITLHQRKCDALFYPATTEKTRFLDSSNNYAWEQRKLGDFFEERNERSGEGELISVTISSGIQKYADLGRFDTKPNDMSNYKKVEVGDIAYNSMRMWQGASGFSPYSGILSPAYTVICPRKGVSSLFFSYLIKRPQIIHLFQINSQGLTPDTWNLKYPAFSRIEASAPKEIDEQDKIADILCRIDHLIALHQCK